MSQRHSDTVRSSCAHCGSLFNRNRDSSDPGCNAPEVVIANKVGCNAPEVVIANNVGCNNCHVLFETDQDYDLFSDMIRDSKPRDLQQRVQSVLQPCTLTKDEYKFLMPIQYDRSSWTASLKKSIRDYRLVLVESNLCRERAILIIDNEEIKSLHPRPNQTPSLHPRSNFGDVESIHIVVDVESYFDFGSDQVDGLATRPLVESVSFEAWDECKIQDVLTVYEAPYDRGYFGLTTQQQHALLRVSNWIFRNGDDPFFDAVPCHKQIVTYTQRHIIAIFASHLAVDNSICSPFLDKVYCTTYGGNNGIDPTDEIKVYDDDGKCLINENRNRIPCSKLTRQDGELDVGTFKTSETWIRNGGLYGVLRHLERLLNENNSDSTSINIWSTLISCSTFRCLSAQPFIAQAFISKVCKYVRNWVHRKANVSNTDAEIITDYYVGINKITEREWLSKGCHNPTVAKFLARWDFPFRAALPWFEDKSHPSHQWMQQCRDMTTDHPFVSTILCMTHHPALIAFPSQRSSHIESVQDVLSEHVLPEIAQIITDYMYAVIDQD